MFIAHPHGNHYCRENSIERYTFSKFKTWISNSYLIIQRFGRYGRELEIAIFTWMVLTFRLESLKG